MKIGDIGCKNMSKATWTNIKTLDLGKYFII